MKILFSSYAPFTTSGYSTQLIQIVNGLFSYDSTIEFGFICWDIPKSFLPYSEKPYTFEYIFNKCSDEKIAINEFNTNIKSKFYICGERKDYWEKIEIKKLNFKCDKLIVFQDIFIFERYKTYKIPCEKYLYIPIHNNFLNINLIYYNNEYSEEINNLYHLPFFDKIATPSLFGVKVLESYGYNPTLIDHIVEETKIEHTKEKILDHFNLKNNFICLIVARNSCITDRKAFIEQLIAFSLFLNGLSKNESDRCRILLHENYKYSLKGTIDLEQIAKKLNIIDNILLTNNQINTKEDILMLYKLADVLLCASKSEGFGLPMVEAQINGTPVITTNCTSMATNTYYGICTEPKEVSISVGGINSWSNPSPENICDAINYIYNLKYKKYNSKYNFELKPIDKKRFSSSTIINKWVHFLDLEKESKKINEIIFDNHLKEITKILSKKKIRNIRESKKCKYNAVLIENRKDIKIESVLLNLLYFTNEEIGIQIFYNHENEDFIHGLINKYNLQNISLIKMSYSDFNIDKYQDFIFSKEFYDNVHGEKILIFQTDSLLLKQFDMNYFNYDFIGAVWNEATIQQEKLFKLFKEKKLIGNGGFNIRDVQKCRRIAAEAFNYQKPLFVNEDNIYSFMLQENLKLLNVKFPSIEEAMYFSVETVYHPDPMAIHAFYKYFYGKEGRDYINNLLTRHIEKLKIINC